MIEKIGLFPTSLMGSMPRTKEFLKEKRRRNNGELSAEDFKVLLEDEKQSQNQLINAFKTLGYDIEL